MKQRVVLHVDVLRILGKLRELQPLRLEFEKSLIPPPVRHMLFVEAYDADDLVTALYEAAYKVEGDRD